MGTLTIACGLASCVFGAYLGWLGVVQRRLSARLERLEQLEAAITRGDANAVHSHELCSAPSDPSDVGQRSLHSPAPASLRVWRAELDQETPAPPSDATRRRVA